MTVEQWKTARSDARLTQVAAAHALKVSQPYLSQLETGLRVASAKLMRKAAHVYALPPTSLPVSSQFNVSSVSAADLQSKLAALGYPGFEHVRAKTVTNPAEVLLRAVATRNLETRLVEALPWLLVAYPDLNWVWLRDRVKLQDAQNKLGYLLHLAQETARTQSQDHRTVPTLSAWLTELEDARLAREGTLCRDSMPEAEKAWLRKNRPAAASHWNLLTSLTADQLPYAVPQ